jgi:hypothetical protein
MCEGRVTGEMPRAHASEEMLMHMMTRGAAQRAA